MCKAEKVKKVVPCMVLIARTVRSGHQINTSNGKRSKHLTLNLTYTHKKQNITEKKFYVIQQMLMYFYFFL